MRQPLHARPTCHRALAARAKLCSARGELLFPLLCARLGRCFRRVFSRLVFAVFLSGSLIGSGVIVWRTRRRAINLDVRRGGFNRRAIDVIGADRHAFRE
jgi:hypothetical protein